MRPALLAAFLLLSVLQIVPASGAQATTDLRLAEILPAPASGEREFVELWNKGNASIDVAGWRIEDAAGNGYTFDSHTIAPDGRLVLWGGGAADALGPAWSNSVVWNNAGDEAILIDAAGAILDSFAYGNHANASHPAPPSGRSLSLQGDDWVEADPTPGYIHIPTGGDVTLEVQNVAPRISDVAAPSRVLVGWPVSLSFQVDDDNGDLADWWVEDAAGPLASGTTAGAQVVEATAPQAPGVWSLAIMANDTAGQQAQVELAIQVATSHIEVALPPDGTVRFPALAPGDQDVGALDSFSLHNLGDTEQVPVLDVSPFTGPANASIPVDGNLRVEWIEAAGGPSMFIDYNGPMTDLPALGPGEQAEVRLHVVQVPLPLAAGDYGTSFSVTG